MLQTFTFLRMFLKGKFRVERYAGDLVFADIVEALPKKLGFKGSVLVPFYILHGRDSLKNKQTTQPKQATKQIQNKWHKHTPYWAYCLMENSSYEHHQCRGNLTPQVSKGELPQADGKETVLEEKPWQVACSELLTGPSPHAVPDSAAWKAPAAACALCRAP